MRAQRLLCRSGVRASVLTALVVVGVAGVAQAQPAASTPPVDQPWTPLDDDGWPRGVTLEEMRSLPPCAPDERLPGPGEPIPCRPLVLPESPQWALAFDWTTGLVDGNIPTTGGVQALGVELDFAGP